MPDLTQIVRKTPPFAIRLAAALFIGMIPLEYPA